MVRTIGDIRLANRIVHGARSEREMTLLDWLREYGAMNLDEMRQVLGHTDTGGARHYADNLVEAGLAIRYRDDERKGRPTTYEITDHGRTVF